MGKYLLGIDAGNTVIKTVLFDRDGNEIAMAAEEGHSHVPMPGHVELMRGVVGLRIRVLLHGNP